jgi:hypothetical protein
VQLHAFMDGRLRVEALREGGRLLLIRVRIRVVLNRVLFDGVKLVHERVAHISMLAPRTARCVRVHVCVRA